MKSFAKDMWLTSDAASPPTDPTTLRSAGILPLVQEIVVKIGKNTNKRREVSRNENSFVCKRQTITKMLADLT